MENAESKSIVKEAAKWIDAHAAEFGLRTSEKLGECVGYLIMSFKDGKGD
jgi:hypothetical protein